MSYERQTDLVLAGSLNLNPHTALIPPEDAIALANWRVDQAGALRSRLDWSLLTNPMAAVHSIHTRLPGTRYFGAGGTLYRNSGGTAAASGFDGKPLGMADMYGFTYVMNRSNQGRDNGAWSDWAPAAPAAAPTIVGPDAGGELVQGQTYYYWVTFVDQWGQETNPSPEVSVTIDGDNRFVSVSIAGLSYGTTIVSWNLYRGGNTLPRPYRVNAQPIDIALNYYADDGGYHQGGNPEDFTGHSDSGLVELGIAMPTDADPPPAARGLAGPYYDRLLAYNTADMPNGLYWSRQGQPSFFPGSQLDEGNHTPVGDDGEEIVLTVLHARHARIYKQASIWRLNGDPGADDATLELTNPEIGLTGPNALDTVGDLDYFESAEGIYTGNGYTAVKISQKLDPLFKGDPLALGATVPALNRSAAARANNSLAVVNGRLYYSYCSGSNTWPDHTLVCDLATGRWYDDDRGFGALYYEGQQGAFLGGSDNLVYTLEQPHAQAMNLAYQSGFRDQGKRDHQKTYADVVVEYSCVTGTPASLDLVAMFDDGAVSKDLGQLTIATGSPPASGRRRDTFQLETTEGLKDGWTARTCAISISGSAPQPVAIYAIEIHYYLHPRDGKTFDSDKTHLGYQGVKRLEMIELDIDAPGGADWNIFTDRPGGVMASRGNATLAATTGRESVQIPLDGEQTEGRLVRLLLTESGSTFRLYGCRIRYRRIGLYIDEGETYTTLEMAA